MIMVKLIRKNKIGTGLIALGCTLSAIGVVVYGLVGSIFEGETILGIVIAVVLLVTFFFMVGIIWRDYFEVDNS